MCLIKMVVLTSVCRLCVMALLLWSPVTPVSGRKSASDERESRSPVLMTTDEGADAGSRVMRAATSGEGLPDSKWVVVMAEEWDEDCRGGGEGLRGRCSQDGGDFSITSDDDVEVRGEGGGSSPLARRFNTHGRTRELMVDGGQENVKDIDGGETIYGEEGKKDEKRIGEDEESEEIEEDEGGDDESDTDYAAYEENDNEEKETERTGENEEEIGKEYKIMTENAEKEGLLINPTGTEEGGEEGEERSPNTPEEREDVITMEEAWRKMEHEPDPVEDINSDLVEYKLQQIMDYYNPDMQEGRNDQDQTSNMSLWRYLVNYVVSGWSNNTPHEEPPAGDQTVEQHPCSNLPGDYNYWSRNAASKEVVVVGGGVAGLAALKTLYALNTESIILLEATNRLGGRIKTVRHSNWVVDEGPDTIQGGKDNPLFQIAQEVGALGDPKPNKILGNSAVTSQGGKVPRKILEKHTSIDQQLRHDLREGALQGYYGKALGDFYSDRYKTLWGAEDEEDDFQASMFIHHQEVSNKFGVDSWTNMSARDADNFIDLGQDYTWWGGMDGIVHYLMDEIPQHQVRTLSPVCKVFWDLPSNGSKTVLVVTADGSSYLTEYLIITIPLAVLKERHFETFFPSFPKIFSHALLATETGSTNRISLGWATSWWGSGPLNLQIFWKDYLFPPEMEWVTSIVQVRSVPHHPGQLEMTVTGEASMVMEKLDPATVISHLVTFLRTINHDCVVPIPLFFHRSRWNCNIWARSSYQSYMTMAGVAYNLQDRSSLNPRLMNSQGKKSLFFGGEHSSSDRYGTVDGAMLSGVRAAKWVLDEHFTQAKQRQRKKGSGARKYNQVNNAPVNYFDFFKNPERFYKDKTPVDYTYAGVNSSWKTISKEERKRLKKRRKLSKQINKKQRRFHLQPFISQGVESPEVMYQDDGGFIKHLPSDLSLNYGGQTLTILPLKDMSGKSNFSIHKDDNSKIEIIYVDENSKEIQSVGDFSSQLAQLVEAINKSNLASEGKSSSVSTNEKDIQELIDNLNKVTVHSPENESQGKSKSQKNIKKVVKRKKKDRQRKNNIKNQKTEKKIQKREETKTPRNNHTVSSNL